MTQEAERYYLVGEYYQASQWKSALPEGYEAEVALIDAMHPTSLEWVRLPGVGSIFIFEPVVNVVGHERPERRYYQLDVKE